MKTSKIDPPLFGESIQCITYERSPEQQRKLADLHVKQVKKAIASKERKVAKYLAKLAILRDHQALLDEKVCDLKVDLYGLREQLK